VQVDTDYQHIFFIFNEIFDDLEDKGRLGRSWWAKQLKNVTTPQATVQQVVNWWTTMKDVIGGIQQGGRGLSRRQSRANR